MTLGEVIGLLWIIGLVGVLLFLVTYGSPGKYQDPPIAWHLFWTGAAGGLQWIGLLLSRWSLIPLLVADAIAVVIVYWRFGLLLAVRTRAARDVSRKD